MTSLLGEKVFDVVSGFSGTVLGEARYLYEEEKVLVVPHGLKDGSPVEGVWFAVARVKLLENSALPGFGGGL